jgi:NAD(P)H dehydrogenase (quinone)
MKEILVLYYSKNGSIQKLANLIARGINSVDGVSARIRTVPNVSQNNAQTAPTLPTEGTTYAKYSDFEECIALALGSPSRFGNMASSLKYFLDGSLDDWLAGSLSGKPACVFTSSSSLHGGQESCLLSMMIPLLHHGMLIMGLPYTDAKLMTTESGCSPYGVSHWSGINDDKEITTDEKYLAILQGKMLATAALKLSKNQN